MKVTFDVKVKIDGRNVGVSLSMRDGAEDVDAKVVEKLMKKLQRLSKLNLRTSEKTKHFSRRNVQYHY